MAIVRRVGTWLRVTCACAALLALIAVPLAYASADGGGRLMENLYGAAATSQQKAWAVGAFGVIVHTVDGGRSWKRDKTPTDEHLFGVDLGSDDRGWAVGRAGIVLRLDGNDSWTQQVSGSDRNLFNVQALSSNEAWVVGDWGAMLHTTDGGEVWKDQSLSEDVILNDVHFVDPMHGWVVGEMGAVFATTDGGSKWTRQDSGTDKTLFGAHFADQQRGWAVGLEGVMVQTVDGGANWKLVRGTSESGSLDQMGFLEILKNPSLYAVRVEGKLGVAVGDMGTILVSRDSGASWAVEDVPGEWRLRWLRGLSLSPQATGLVVGASGLTIPVVDGTMRYPEK